MSRRQKARDLVLILVCIAAVVLLMLAIVEASARYPEPVEEVPCPTCDDVDPACRYPAPFVHGEGYDDD